MLKIGDKLLCKKSDKLLCKKDDISYNNFKNHKGEYYIITKIYDNVTFISFISVGNLDYFNKKNSSYYIWDYFYKPQELRKLKLEKLNDVENR